MGALLDASGCHILNPTTTACRDIPPPKYVTKTITTEHYAAAAETATASTLFYRTKPSDQNPEDGMRQVPLEHDINIASNGCSWFATSTQKGPFIAMLMTHYV